MAEVGWLYSSDLSVADGRAILGEWISQVVEGEGEVKVKGR